MNYFSKFSLVAIAAVASFVVPASAFATEPGTAPVKIKCAVPKPRDITAKLVANGQAAITTACPTCTNIKVRVKFKIPKQAASAPFLAGFYSASTVNQELVLTPNGMQVGATDCQINNVSVKTTLSYKDAAKKRHTTKTEGTMILSGLAQ